MIVRAVDTNILVYAHIASFEQHLKAKSFLEGELGKIGLVLTISPLVLHEFIHIITDSRRFEPPVSMSEACQIARLYLQRENVQCLPVDEKTLLLAISLLTKYKLGRKRIADTIFAATLLRNNVSELITANPSDYQQFTEIRTINPLD